MGSPGSAVVGCGSTEQGPNRLYGASRDCCDEYGIISEPLGCGETLCPAAVLEFGAGAVREPPLLFIASIRGFHVRLLIFLRSGEGRAGRGAASGQTFNAKENRVLLASNELIPARQHFSSFPPGNVCQECVLAG
jgi:hypothetical protein